MSEVERMERTRNRRTFATTLRIPSPILATHDSDGWLPRFYKRAPAARSTVHLLHRLGPPLHRESHRHAHPGRAARTLHLPPLRRVPSSGTTMPLLDPDLGRGEGGLPGRICDAVVQGEGSWASVGGYRCRPSSGAVISIFASLFDLGLDGAASQRRPPAPSSFAPRRGRPRPQPQTCRSSSGNNDGGLGFWRRCGWDRRLTQPRYSRGAPSALLHSVSRDPRAGDFEKRENGEGSVVLTRWRIRGGGRIGRGGGGWPNRGGARTGSWMGREERFP